jgi:LL-diaminopimelate aminotransferase
LKTAKRVSKLSPYLFAEIDHRIAEKKSQGVKIINFGIGDPDRPTPEHIVRSLCQAAQDPENHRYPPYQGLPAFLESVSHWFRNRFGVELDPEREVLGLLGSKDGISHFPLAFIDPGDVALVPDPGYPVYETATIFAGGEPYPLSLREENDYLPQFEKIPEEVLRRAKVIFINYPHNPTTAVANLPFLEETVEFARKHELIIAHDLAYSEITYDGYVAPSLLQVEGARDICVEFHSLSKTYNMTGWRIAFAVGGAELISAFATLKTNIDSGIFNAIQLAGVEALEGSQDCVAETREIYLRRRNRLLACLERLGWEAKKPLATIYVWMKVPPGFDSASFATYLLERAALVVVPGSAYGPGGEGYVRFSLTLPDEELEEGIDRLYSAFL